MEPTPEKKNRIDSLSTDEMLHEINLGRKSRFQRESFAYLQYSYQKRIKEEQLKNLASQNQSTDKATYIINKIQNIDSPGGQHNLRNFAFLVAVAVFAALAIWVIGHYSNLKI